MKLVYIVLFVIFFVIDNIHGQLNNNNNNNNDNDTSSSNSDVALTINIVIDQTSSLSYNITECGAPSLPCKSFNDAGISARYLLNNNKDSLVPLNLIIELKNINYKLSDSGVLDNLYGFCDIQIKNSNSSIIIDGTNYFESSSFLTLKLPNDYIYPSYTCGFSTLKLINFQFSNFYLPSYSPVFLISDQLPNQLYSYIYFNIFSSTFSNINNPILKSQNQQQNNNNNNNNSNNSSDNLNPYNYNIVVMVSSSTFIGISSFYDGVSVSPAIFQIESGVLQIISTSIQNVTFTKSSPQFIYLYNGNLKIFQSLFKNIRSSSPLPFILTLESAYSTQIDTITFRENKIGKWLQINQTSTPPSINNDSNVTMDYILLTDSDFYDNTFKSLYNNNNFIIINSNNQLNNIVLNSLKFYNNILLDSDQPSSSDSSSSSSSSRDISNFKLTSTSSFIYLQGPNNYKLTSSEFRDDLDLIFLLYLNQTNLGMSNSILLSVDPVGGMKSNVTMDSLSYISGSSNLYYCKECTFNGKPPQKPGLISTTTAILLILAFLVVLGVLGVVYVKYAHKKISENIKNRIKARKQKRFMHLDSDLTSALDSQHESLLSNYNDDEYQYNYNNNNNSSINNDKDYNKYKVVGDLE